MEGDFAIYVIGIQGHSKWLSVPLTQERWQSPEERLQSVVLLLSDSERAAWEEYKDAYTSLPYAFYAADFRRMERWYFAGGGQGEQWSNE